MFRWEEVDIICIEVIFHNLPRNMVKSSLSVVIKTRNTYNMS